MSAFEGQTDREIYVAMRRAAAELVRRYEQHLELVVARDDERAAALDKVSTIRFSERVFREFYERCRDVRETIEDIVGDWEDYKRRQAEDP